MRYIKYLTVSMRMLFRERGCKNAGVEGYAEAFTTMLSGRQTSKTAGYLLWVILEIKGFVFSKGVGDFPLKDESFLMNDYRM